MHYYGTYCDLRLVEPSDAQLILDLRLNAKLNRYLSQTNGDVKSQEEWILKYKERESVGLEYYFLVLDKTKINLGTIRVYKIDYSANKFTIGSWIIKEGSDPRVSLESILAAEKFAFYCLKLEYNYFDVRKGNKSVIRFHKSRGAELIGEDECNFYFVFKKLAFDAYLNAEKGILSIAEFK